MTIASIIYVLSIKGVKTDSCCGYSYRIASMGSRRAAFRAGYQPKEQ